MLMRLWDNRSFHSLLAGMRNGIAILEDSWELIRKLNIRLMYDLAIVDLAIYPNELGQVI